jgi:LysM repeat protein
VEVTGFFLFAAVAIVTVIVFRLRWEGDRGLDRSARRRIARRVADVTGDRARARTAPETTDAVAAVPGSNVRHMADFEPPPAGPRFRLGRDTSAVLMVVGFVLMVFLILDRPGPAGSVLQATATPQPGAVQNAPGPSAGQSGAPTTPATSTPTSSSGPGATVRASQAPAQLSPTPNPSVRPTPEPTTPRPTASPRATSDRFAVLTPCPGTSGCYVYVVRRGDNLVSIANWFGIPLETVLRLNPQISDPTTVVAGDRITLPTPRR